MLALYQLSYCQLKLNTEEIKLSFSLVLLPSWYHVNYYLANDIGSTVVS